MKGRVKERWGSAKGVVDGVECCLAESRKNFDRANQADHDLSRTFRAGTRALTLESLVSRYGRSRLAPRSRFRP